MGDCKIGNPKEGANLFNLGFQPEPSTGAVTPGKLPPDEWKFLLCHYLTEEDFLLGIGARQRR